MSNPAAPRFLDRATPPHLLTLVLMAGIQAMALNIFLPSLPAMAEHFQVPYAVIQLSVALFLATNGVLQLFIGPLSDRFGRRPVLLAGFTVFLVATLGSIYAPSIQVFLVFRMMQAAIVVALVLSRAIVRDMYDQESSASMIGYVTMGMSVVPMLSPAIGGWLQTIFGWQATFWALFILGAAIMVLVFLDNGETHHQRSSSFRDQFRGYPELFRSQRFWGYALATTFSAGTFFAYLGGGPFVGVQVFRLEPDTFGLLFGAPAVGYLIGNGITGRFAARAGINRLVLAGTSITAFGVGLSLLLFAVGSGTALTFFGLMTLVGLGNGLVVPNATAGLLSVRPQLAGTASGLGGSLMILGGASLSALAGSFLDPRSGPYPLLIIMLGASLLGIATIVFVIWRERRIGIA